MSEIALLNPQLESDACRKLIGLAQDQLTRLETKLLNLTLPREEYLEIIGAAKIMRDTVADMESMYASTFNK